MLVTWRTTARAGFFLGSRTLSSTAGKPQSVDFSKAVEDFKKNGVAILPLKMEEEYIGKSRCVNLFLDRKGAGVSICSETLIFSCTTFWPN